MFLKLYIDLTPAPRAIVFDRWTMKAGQYGSTCIHEFETSDWEKHWALGIAWGHLDLIMGNKSHLHSASMETQWIISFLWFLISIITMKAFLAQLILQGWPSFKPSSEDPHKYGLQMCDIGAVDR